MSKEIFDPAESLLALNLRGKIFRKNEQDQLKVEKPALFEHTRGTVFDKETAALIEVDLLHKSIDHTITRIGSAALYRSLLEPPVSIDETLAKQDAVKELQSNDALSTSIEDYLHEIQNGESAFFKFLNIEIDRRYPYPAFRRAMKAGQNIHKASSELPDAESPYCRELIEKIRGFNDSEIYKLMRGPIYKTFSGLQPKEDVKFYTPRMRFRPWLFNYLNSSPIISSIAAIGALTSGILTPEMIHSIPGLTELLVTSPAWTLCSLVYTSQLKPTFDFHNSVVPLLSKAYSSQPLMNTIDAIGRLDELQSFIAFSKKSPFPTVLPEITNDRRHHFSAVNMRNPVLAAEMENFVPNDIDLKEPLTFLTGPNSGGKSTIIRSIVQNQILGQIGCFVAADKAIINHADRIAYQATKYDSTRDRQGRYGTEMERTKPIFYSATPASLNLLDELSEGTTIEERNVVSYKILRDFRDIGCSTINATHNHELVDRFQQSTPCQFYQVEFNGTDPTHRIIPGISRVSHAERVLEDIGFSEEDRDKHLRTYGYR